MDVIWRVARVEVPSGMYIVYFSAFGTTWGRQQWLVPGTECED